MTRNIKGWDSIEARESEEVWASIEAQLSEQDGRYMANTMDAKHEQYTAWIAQIDASIGAIKAR